MKKIFSFGGKKEGQDAAAKQPKKVVDAKNADILVEHYRKNIEEVLKKIDQNFENIRQDEGYQGLVTQYQTAYFTWTIQKDNSSSQKEVCRAARQIILFYLQNIINPALKQIEDLTKIQPKANKQEEVDLSENLSKMLIAIDRDILTYNKQLGELHKSATTSKNKKYIEKYNEIKKEHFEHRKAKITEEHNFEKDILKNLKLIIRARATKQGIYLQSKTPAAGIREAAGGDAVRAARSTSASSNPPGAGSAAAGGDAVRAAVRNSARASSPGSESSRTESAADSLLAEQADEIEARAAGRSPARASSPGGALPQKKEEQSTKGLRTIIAQDPSGLTMPFRPISPVQQRAGDSPRKKINERSKGGLSVLATPQPKTMGVPEPSYAIEAGAAGRSPARASSPGGSRNAIEARATTPPQRTNSLGGALPQPGAGGGGGPLSNPPGAGGDSPAMRRQTRYEVIESINEKQIYFLINIAKGLQGKNKEEVTTLLTEIANKKPELYQQVLRDDDELGPAYSKHFIDEFYKDENSQSTQFIEALIADNNELRVIKTIFSTIKTRQQPIVHRDGPDQGASDEQGRAWTNCIFGGGARSNPTKATSTLEGDDISIASSTSSGAEHNPGRV